MPLSKPSRRRLYHRRVVECCGFQREDGLWDIEGRMQDIKSENAPLPMGGEVAAGEAFHNIAMRITLDEQLLIHDVEAVIDASPLPTCPQISEAYQKLKGTRIGPGWHKQCGQLLGGFQGCTHLSELLRPIATTAIQTLWPNNDSERARKGAGMMINSCHGWAQNSEVIRLKLPEYYKPYTPDNEPEEG